MQSEVKNIMIIDDNEIDLKINSKIIEISKICENILLFQSAQSALDYLFDHLDNLILLPDLILLDIQMPDMNGFEFLEKIAEFPEYFTKKCNIAMLSSTLDYGDIKKAEANIYVSKLLKKPLQLNELKEILQY